MSDSDLIKLYSGRILELAASIPHHARLEAPTGSARKRSPLCGSTVTVDVELRDGVVVAFGQDVKACALGQASAAIFGAAVLGCSLPQLQQARDQVYRMLTAEGSVPDAPFHGYEVLIPARGYKNRHASILLVLDATIEAASAPASTFEKTKP